METGACILVHGNLPHGMAQPGLTSYRLHDTIHDLNLPVVLACTVHCGLSSVHGITLISLAYLPTWSTYVCTWGVHFNYEFHLQLPAAHTRARLACSACTHTCRKALYDTLMSLHIRMKEVKHHDFLQSPYITNIALPLGTISIPIFQGQLAGMVLGFGKLNFW